MEVLVTSGILSHGKGDTNIARQTALRQLKVLRASLFIFIAARSPSMDAAEVHSPKGHVRAALDRRADIAFEDPHLTDVVGELRDRFHVELQLDEPSPKDIGVELDKIKSLQSHQRQLDALSDATADRLTMMGIDVTTNTDIIKQITSLPYPGLSFQQKDVSLRSALRYILAEVGETVSVMERDGTLWVTSQEVADSRFTTRVYGVTDIAISPDSSHQVNDEAFNPAFDATHWDQLDYDTLIVILNSHVAPATWDDVGGEGAIGPANGSLTILQTEQAHEMIGATLNALRQVRALTEKKPGEGTPIPVFPSAEMAERESRIADALEKETSPDF